MSAHIWLPIFARFILNRSKYGIQKMHRQKLKKSYRIPRIGYSRIAYLLVSLNSYSKVIIPINRVMIMYQVC